MSVRWQFGEPAAREATERWHAGESPEAVVRDNPRRRIVRIEGSDGALLVKQFRVGSGRHRLRETLKAQIGSSPAAKEARALRRIPGAPVPEALALGVLPDGDRVLVLPWVEAHSADEILALSDPAERVRWMQRLGEAVQALHAAGVVHRDLHAGNLLFASDGVRIVDLQSARASDSREARLRDVASLLFSLRGRIDAEERDALVQAALGDPGPSVHERLDRLMALRARAYGASRTRRAMRPGRRFARWRGSAGSGLRQRGVEPERLEAWLGAHRGERATVLPIKREGRVAISQVERSVDPAQGAVVIKETRAGLGRAIADLVRGSAGRRAWRAGHGLLARDVTAAEPLAFAERRTLGLPFSSLVVLVAVEGSDGVGASSDPAALDAQLELVASLHRRAIDHGDLKASNWIHRPGDRRAVLVDLEGVRFRRRLSDDRRIEGLAQWNASLPDGVPSGTRRRIFDAYARSLPFSGDPAAALREIVRRSLARAHRWTGRDCKSEGASPG